MENRSHAITVGLFTLVLGLAVVFAFWWLSGSREEHTEYFITSSRPVTGLNREATVKFRGVEVGKVKEIALDKKNRNDIHIRIEVAKTLLLSQEAYAELRMQGVTGLAYIDLNDPSDTAPRLEPSGTIRMRPSFVDRITEHAPHILEQIESLVQNSSEVATSVNQTLGKINTGKLNQAIGNIEKASARLAPLIDSANTTITRFGAFASEKNQQQLSNTLRSLKQTSDEARPLFNELSNTAGEFRNTAGEFRNTASALRQSTQQLSESLQQETLPRLNSLTDSLERDSRHFDQLMQMLEDNPQSLLLGKPEAQPGPGEPGFEYKH